MIVLPRARSKSRISRLSSPRGNANILLRGDSLWNGSDFSRSWRYSKVWIFTRSRMSKIWPKWIVELKEDAGTVFYHYNQNLRVVSNCVGDVLVSGKDLVD